MTNENKTNVPESGTNNQVNTWSVILQSNVNINFKPKVNFNRPKNNWQNRSIMVNQKTAVPKFDAKWEQPVKIWSLMWLEQVWQCIFLEYGEDIIIMDCGLEFSASETMWADYIIPDITYLKKNIKKIKWVVLTHGHLDHVGALRHILPELGWPMVYTTPLTLWIVKKTLEENKTVNKLKYKIVDPDIDLVKIGCFTIEFVRVNHNIPETFALAIQTPKWLIFNSADFKIDHTPAFDKPADLPKIARIGQEGVKLYIWDSLWSDRKWRSKSEKIIGENLDELIIKAKSRLIIACFASNIWRIIQIIQSAVRADKIVFLSGRSMENYVAICIELWYINVPKSYLRKIDANADSIPDHRVVILTTWAQGEEFSALARISRGEFPLVKLRKWDSILISATTIPGNENQMHKMLNDLIVQDINLITNNDMDIHASGHGYEEDHKLMLSLTHPEYFLPFYTQPIERYSHRKIWLDMWISDDHILMPKENGSIIEMYDNIVRLSDTKLKLDTILVDGKWIWGLEWEYVMKARKIMADSGLLNIILKIDAETRDLVGNIQIESRWFVYTNEIRKVHTDTVKFVELKYNELKKQKLDIKIILKQIKTDLEFYLDRMLGRTPMIVPMFVYINKDGKEIKIDILTTNDQNLDSSVNQSSITQDNEVQEINQEVLPNPEY